MNREDFPMLRHDYVYLDNGATTFKPKEVIDAITDYYQNYSGNAHRGDYEISYKVDLKVDAARELVKSFINAKSSKEIVFTSGDTESLNFIAEGFFKDNLEEYDEIILTKSEHASNVLPWFRLAKTKNVVIKYALLDDNHYLTLDNLKKVITPKTKVISLAHITNVIGDERPIKEICDYAHKHNIFVVLDAAQSVAHKKVDVQDLDVDFMAFSAHKMCGPTGIGVLYGKFELLNELKPVNLGGGMNESFDNYDEVFLKELPTRLEAGTPNIAGIIGLGAAITYLNKIGMDKICKYEKDLRSYAISKLSTIEHLTIVNKKSDSGIIAFNIKDIFSQDVAYYLNKYKVCLRAGNHCAKILKDEIGIKNTVRLSLYFYNTKEEIDKVYDLLKDKDRILKEMI